MGRIKREAGEMITQIKRVGGSLVIRLGHSFVKYMDLKENEWVDITDIKKVEKKEKEND
jgi:antitoxin component of MazEF toxin-antitoxin module